LPLLTSTGYHINISSGAFKDASTNEIYTGIADNVTWNFVTSSGASITSPTLGNICIGGDYKNLGNIVITENISSDFSVGNSQLLVLNAPTNFEFQPSTGTVNVSGGDISFIRQLSN
jgi:hypothetical protein